MKMRVLLILFGVGAIIILILAATRWKEIAAMAHLHRLRSDNMLLMTAIEEPEGTPERIAVRTYLRESKPARRQVIEAILSMGNFQSKPDPLQVVVAAV